MENVMIIVIVIAIAGYGLYATIQHFRGDAVIKARIERAGYSVR